MIDNRFRQGFTLIELSIVIIVISLITGMGVATTMGVLESARVSQTQKKMDVIEEALMRYRVQNDRLPCPSDQTLSASDSGYGRQIIHRGYCKTGGGGTPYEVTGSDTFRSHVGGVPTRDLGLPDEFMFDGWGRRFTYAVDSELARPYAFTVVHPRATGCSITVKTATSGGATLSSNSIYALISYGANGHGAFTNGSTRLNRYSTNTDEMTNCHCTSGTVNVSLPSALTYIQKDPVESTSGVAGFDDIVRYKERWQMQTESDAVAAANYVEHQVGASYKNGASAYFYKRGCHKWAAAADTSLTYGAGYTIYGIAFKPDRTGFMFCSISTNRPFCKPYSHALGNSSTATAGTTIGLGTSDTVTHAMSNFSDNGYVASSFGVEPYVKIYRSNGTTYNDLNNNRYESGAYGALVSVDDMPARRPTILRFSRDGNYLFMTDQNSYAQIWGRYDSARFKVLFEFVTPGLTDMAGACYNSEIDRIGDAAFSPDGRFFAMTCQSRDGTDTSLIVWKIKTGYSFVNNDLSLAITDVVFGPQFWNSSTSAIENTPPVVAFSPDSRYVAIVGGDASARSIASNIKIYMINHMDEFKVVDVNSANESSPDPWPTGSSTAPIPGVPIAFTGDSNHLLVGISYGGGAYGSGNGIAVFRRYSPTEFRYEFPSATSTPFTGNIPSFIATAK